MNIEILIVAVAVVLLTLFLVSKHLDSRKRQLELELEREKELAKQRLLDSLPQRKLWTENECMIAAYIALYGDEDNYELIEALAILMGRTPSSLSRKIDRFTEDGPGYGTSKLDKKSYATMKKQGAFFGMAEFYKLVGTYTEDISFLNEHMN